MIKEAIARVIEKSDLSLQEMREVMNEIMSGESTGAQISSFITALRIKGETVEEITGAAMVMREKAEKINTKAKDVIDTCGTGGDGAHTFNISTISAFVVAGAGITVAKHGNRAVSSQCGSADLLKALGVNIEAKKDIVERCIDEIGIGFLFAPMLHGAMKYAIGPRREIGIRTIFNILGPLTNPAGARFQLLGVYDAELTEVIANVLKKLGSKHAFVVHGMDGIDEITLTTQTKVSELKNDKIETYMLNPEDFGMKRCAKNELIGGDPTYNANILKEVLNGFKGYKRDVVLLNAAAAIVAGGVAQDFKEGIVLAQESIDSKKAMEKLEGLIRITRS